LFSPTSNPQNSTPSIGFNESAFFSDDEPEESMSDMDERLTINKPAISHPLGPQTRSVTDGSHSLESMIRSGMRRLTGGAATNREKERQREMIRAQQRAMAQTIGSPRVPKVPAEYLPSNPTSPGH